MAHHRWLEPAPLSQTSSGPTESPLLNEILIRRGILRPDEAHRFLAPSLDDLGDPFDLPDLDQAVARIRSALRLGKGIAVFGDYDVDGLTSTAVLAGALRALGGQVSTYLPNRITDGYGLNQNAVRQLAADGAELLIAVDCGSSDSAELALAQASGLETIVVDHHHVHSDSLPGTAFVSPRRPACRYPFRDLAAVGVTYHLVRALLGDQAAARYLPLVALGTVADVVPLVGENRVLVSLGLARFGTDAPVGLRALASAARIEPEAVSSWHCGFVLGPRINAAGRMHDPRPALRLLMTDNSAEARELSDELNRLNAQRQRTLEAMLDQAELQLEAKGEPPSLLLVANEAWSVGIVGLVASRLSDRYRRPAVVLSQAGGLGRGSARSVEGFDIADALERCGDLLIEHGGHGLAAGLTVHPDKLVELEARLSDLALMALGAESTAPALSLDAELRFGDLTYATASTIARLEPFGHGNPAPQFLLRGARLKDLRLTRDGKHLQLQIVEPLSDSVRGIYFGGAHAASDLERMGRADIAFTLKADTFNGRHRAEIEVLDYRPSTI